MLDYQEARRTAGLLAAVAEPTRVRNLLCLCRGPEHVGRLAERLGAPMPSTSHHLGVLRQAGLVEDRRDGRRVVYQLRPDVYAPGDGDPVVGTLTVGGVRLQIVGRPAAPPPDLPPRKAVRKVARPGPPTADA